ncbi:MAG: chloride channel protein [Phycisphaerales bacterium]
MTLRDRLPRPAARWTRSFGLSILVGLIAGVAAAALEKVIEIGSDELVGGFTHLGRGYIGVFDWGVLLLPAAGCLVAGLGVMLFARSSPGHGVDQLTRAFHREMGRMPVIGPAVKAVGAALVISCGGSAGPEGTTAALGAGIGSTLGRIFPITPHERRILLVAGCAAGIGAIFRCPLGGALFATSVLYSDPEFEADAMVSSVVASVIAYSTFMFFRGLGEPLLQNVSDLTFGAPIELLPYAILGPLCGVMSIFFFACLYLVERVLVPASKLPLWATAGLGGLATGALALALPQVMDGRYQFIQNAIDDQLFPDDGFVTFAQLTLLFGAVAIVKCIATGLTIGSGAPGGVLGPAVFIGATLGAFLGAASEWLAPDLFTAELRDSLIVAGMGGVLAASMRTPLAAVVMTIEMTHAYGLIAPLMLVCISSYVVGRRFGLNSQQVRTAADSPAHAADPIIHLLEGWRVEALMEKEWPLRVTPEVGLDELARQIEPGTAPVFAVTRNGDLVGLISATDISRLREDEALGYGLIAEDIMNERFATVHPEDDAYYALDVCQRTAQDVVPVLSHDHHRRWIGMFSREHVAERLREHFEETQATIVREHAGLEAIEHDLQAHQLLMSVAPRDTSRVQKLFVPMQAVGQSLREADFRRRFNAQIVAIELADGTFQCPPDPDTPLRTDMRLLAIVLEGGSGASSPPEASV